MNILLPLFLILSAGLLNGCDAEPPIKTAPSPYPVVDSRYFMGPDSGTLTCWIDSHRVLFKGDEFGPRRGKLYSLYLWDIKQSTISMYAENAGSFCCQENRVYYDLDRRATPGTRVMFHGSFGEEERIEVPDSSRRYSLNKTSCSLRENSPRQRDEPFLYPLLEDHGVLDFGVTDYADKDSPPLVYIRASDGKKITLPFRAALASFVTMRWYPFQGAYLIKTEHWDESIQHGIDPGPNGFPQPLWWLYPDGRTEKIPLPWTEWQSSGSLEFFGTRKGLFVVSHNGPRHYGGYLLQTDQYKKIINGVMLGTSISPDGCKAAFYHAINWEAQRLYQSEKLIMNPETKPSIKMIDFCSEK